MFLPSLYLQPLPGTAAVISAIRFFCNIIRMHKSDRAVIIHFIPEIPVAVFLFTENGHFLILRSNTDNGVMGSRAASYIDRTCIDFTRYAFCRMLIVVILNNFNIGSVDIAGDTVNRNTIPEIAGTVLDRKSVV